MNRRPAFSSYRDQQRMQRIARNAAIGYRCTWQQLTGRAIFIGGVVLGSLFVGGLAYLVWVIGRNMG